MTEYMRLGKIRGFLYSILLFFVIVPLSGQKQADAEYKFRHLTSAHGLSSNQVTSIYKDRYGFVWFGTISGLNRYDGHSVKVYKNIPGDTTTIPFNNVQRIAEDHKGRLWVFSQDNSMAVFNPGQDVFSRNVQLNKEGRPVPSEFITDIATDQDSNLWVTTNQFGVHKVHSDSGKREWFGADESDSTSLQSDYIDDVEIIDDSTVAVINHWGVIELLDRNTVEVLDRFQPEYLASLNNTDFYSLFVDEDGDFWIFSQESDRGLFYYDPDTGDEKHFTQDEPGLSIGSDIVTGVIQGMDNRIWVGTDHGGLQIIDKKDFSVKTVRRIKGASNGLSQNSITAMMRDDSETIWIGTYKEGVNYYHSDLFQFRLLSHNPLVDGSLPAKDINCFAEDKYGNLYIGTNGSGLIYYNREDSDFALIRANPDNPDSLSHDVIVSLLYDSKERLWIGTYYGGLNCYDGDKFKRYVHDQDDPSTISDNRIWKIHEDSEGRIWVGTLGGGLDLLDERNDRFLHYRDGDLNSVNSNFILTINEDRQGNLWIGTSFGINVLNNTTGRFSHIPANPGKENALSHHIVLSIIEDSRGLMWIGTRNGLNLYDPASETFKLFLESDGLPDNNILNLLEDDEGNIWMSTLNGLSRLEVKETKGEYEFSFSNFDLLDGLQSSEFNEHSAYKTSSGELIFGGPDGFNIFQPEEIKKSPHPPKVLLTGLRLFNEKVEVGETFNDDPILEKPLFLSDTLVLRHNQNVFSLEFSGIGYFHTDKIHFDYILENFNDQWVSTDASNRLATYTNLNPGTYKFRIAGKVAEDGKPGPETSLHIIIKPPFYATSYAYVAYFILFVSLVVALGLIIRRSERIKYERQQELSEHERIHELDAMKIRFFTNISHEFRTPLTLIITPLEKLIEEVKEEKIKNQLVVVFRNAKRLLGLVNQLLDFRKIEVQGITLHKTRHDIVAFVKDVALSFSDLFESKSIRFTVHSSINKLEISFDADKLEKIIFNLLSNAFRYSTQEGQVDLALSYIDENSSDDTKLAKPVVKISVSDTGIGIPEEKQERIFERFFQADNKGNNMGSGIGLAIVSEFVRLHGGHISVKSEPGQGSVFTVELPADTEEGLSTSSPLEMELTSGVVSNSKLLEDPVSTKDKPLVLIVEDNEDLRFYLKENLKYKYKIIEASNGIEGLEKAISVFPNVIISDIMMPGLDGVELIRKLKSDTRAAQIPVILLTARVSSQQEVEGLVAGASDYIAKPFNYEVLAIKIQKLIEDQKRGHKETKQHYEISPAKIGVTSRDDKFIKKATSFVERNISNTELSVEKFSREMGMSRGHLYNKILELTGKTPVEFIRIMRLKRAAQLLGRSQLNVAEVALKVGFNDPKYFSRYFKDEYGVSPSEYARRNKLEE